MYSFLRNLPPLLTSFPIISTMSPNWKEELIKQGDMIKEALLVNYPLAFGDSLGSVADFAAIKPIDIHVTPGAKPVNRSTCPSILPGMEQDCCQMIGDLEKQGVIRRYDFPTDWCAPARFILKNSGKPRLVINYQGLNSRGTRIGYPFSSVQDIHAQIKNGTLFLL